MASVFLSYDRDDAAKARSIALALEKAGHSVWWDRHIKGGAQYSQEIEEALKRADAVVVLWSAQSVQSAWVRDEAAAGRDSGRLIPVSLDRTEAPLGFRQYQTIDLSGWKGRRRTAQLTEIAGAVESVGAGGALNTQVAPRTINRFAPMHIRYALVIGLAVAFLLAGLAYWQPWRGSPVPVVAVAAASPSPAAASLARDLLAKLGQLNATQTETLKLVQGGQADASANFVFEVDGQSQGQSATANLVLLGGQERALLWSKDFALARQADLKQQLAHTAAKVLECAIEALTSNEASMRQATLKLYLNGCSAYAETSTADPRPLIPVFRAVVEQAPRFEGAWAMLLNAEAEITISGEMERDREKMEPQLLRHLAQARKLNPDMAEVLLADADLAPAGAFAQRMGLIKRAVERNPKSTTAISAYSSYLLSVGRAYAAVDQAKLATQLDPLSPATRDTLITALTYSGQIDVALEELSKAERLWPGASSLLAARYRIHLRYGDPQIALQIQRLGDYGGPHRDLFLQARIDPSLANIEKAIARPREWLKISPRAMGELAQVLGAFGKEEELFQRLLSWGHPEEVDTIIAVLFRPALQKFRRDPRMIAVAKRLGLLDYWQTSGEWPDFCREPDLPYDCKVEAAKLN